MNYKILMVEVFAIVAAYLIMSLPVASATEVSTNVRILIGDGAMEDFDKIIDPAQYIIRDITSDFGDQTINIQIRGNSGADIERVYIFNCGDDTPVNCGMGSPILDTFMDPSSVTYYWADISSGSDTVNLMIFVKYVVGEIYTWQGFWHTITKNYIESKFDITGSSSDDYLKEMSITMPLGNNHDANKLERLYK